MWHEARRQEKKIRGLMVDYKKRAERRRQYYERIKQDPTQFVRVIGRQMPIHLEHSVVLAAESPQSIFCPGAVASRCGMPWQGNPDVTIDRFDVRAHLDYISDVSDSADPKLCKADQNEERKCSYERYRILVQNECTGVSEEQCLQQIYTDELFGAVEPKKSESESKKPEKKAAIGYTYDDSTSTPAKSETDLVEKEEEDAEESSDEEIDLDIAFDVDDLTTEQSNQLNLCARDYGMKGDDYLESLYRDKEEAEAVRQARLLEEEKAQFSGRKSRRERRAYKDKRMKERMMSPPSYAARDSPTYNAYKKSSSSSRSRSPSPVKTKMKFITSFGGDDEDDVPVHGPSLPPPSHTSRSDSKGKSTSYLPRKSSTTSQDRSRSGRRDRSRSGGRPSGRYGRSRSSGRSRYSRRQSRSRSRSWSRTNRRRYSRSRSRGRKSWSASSRSSSRSRQRSMRSRSVSSSTSRSRSRSPRRQSSPLRQPTPPLKRYRRSSRSSSSSSSSPSPKGASPPPIKRYRRPSLSSSNNSSNSDDDDGPRKSDTSSNPGSTHKSDGGKVIGISRGLGATNKTLLTPQERLRRRMQVQLNRQYKADKKAQREKQDKVLQQQLDREEELKLRGIEMRRREREKRHREKEGGVSTDEDTWSGKNGDDNKAPIDDKSNDHKLDKPDDRQTDRHSAAWQTDRHDTRDSSDWRTGRTDADGQMDRHHGRSDSDWRTDRRQRDAPDCRSDRSQGPPDRHGPPDRQGFSRDRYHWHAERRQSVRDDHSSDMHRSTYRRRSPSPRQYDQRSRSRPTTADTSSRPPRLVDY